MGYFLSLRFAGARLRAAGAFFADALVSGFSGLLSAFAAGARTSRALRADTRTKRAVATVRMLRLARRRGGGLLRRAMRLEGARERELTEPMTNHVLRHVHRDELPAVVDGERVAHELRRDRGAAR